MFVGCNPHGFFRRTEKFNLKEDASGNIIVEKIITTTNGVISKVEIDTTGDIELPEIIRESSQVSK
jgi:hypothetical protein